MNFANIPVSTQTFTVNSNIQYINLQDFYNVLELISNSDGQILCVKYQKLQKGIENKKVLKRTKEPNIQTKRNFLNCITLIINIEKKINVKMFKNGVFQLTGCKNARNVKKCLDLITCELRKNKDCFIFNENDIDFIFYIRSAMRNVDFDVGFKIKKNELLKYLESNTTFIVPPPIGNKMDTKIRIPILREDIEKMLIIKLSYPEKSEEMLEFKTCFDIIEPDKKKLSNKLENKFVSITVFQNGKVLLSGIDESFQEKYYTWFVNLATEIRPLIENVVPKKISFLNFGKA